MNVEQALDLRLGIIFPDEILKMLKEYNLYKPILNGQVKDAVTLYEFLPNKFLRYSYANLKDFAEEITPFLIKGSILEIACGRGNLIIELLQKGFAPVYGVDASAAQLEAAKKRLLKDKSEVKLILGRAENFDYSCLPKVSNIILREFWGFLSRDISIKLLKKLKSCLTGDGQIIIGPHIYIREDDEMREAYRILNEQLGFVMDYKPIYEFEDYGYSKQIIKLNCGETHYILKPL